jgi:chaperone required for assembly of F1-ATPase
MSHSKRFYRTASTAPDGAGVSVLLDGRAIRTPAKAKLSLPSQALAEAVAEEWMAQGDRIDPATMPLTRLANSAIDGVTGREAAVLDDLVAYAGSDLLCYRAEGPEGLIAKQNEQWDPVLTWAKQDLEAPLNLTHGVVHIAQPETTLERLRQRAARLDTFGLAAMHVMTSLTGSALLALAVAEKRLTPDQAWTAAHVDEDWQISQWGDDAEAAARRTTRRRDFDAACRLLELLAH